MTIKSYKKADGKTYYQFSAYLGLDAKGKPKRTTRRGFKTRKDAQIAFLKLQTETEETASKRYRYKEVYEIWLKQYRHNVKDSTYNKTIEIFRLHILPVFGEMYVDKISLKDAQEFTNNLFLKLVKYKEIKNRAAVVMDQAIRLKAIKDNPFNLVVLPRKPLSLEEASEEEFKNVLTKQELHEVLKQAETQSNPMALPFFRLLAFSGLRRGEALALTWADVDFETNLISVSKTLAHGIDNKQIVQSPKTKKSVRVINLDQITMDILKFWKAKQKEILNALGYDVNSPEQLLFTTYHNTFVSFNWPATTLDRMIEAAEVPRITTHGFRHTHCSLLFEAGASIPEVMERLGHTDYKTTMNIYNHVSAKKKEEALDKLSEYLAF